MDFLNKCRWFVFLLVGIGEFLFLRFCSIDIIKIVSFLVFVIIIVALMVNFLDKKKNTEDDIYILAFLGRSLTAKGVGNLFGVFLVIHTIIHIGFIQSYFLDLLKSNYDYSFWHLLTSIDCFLLPFVLPPPSSKRNKKPVKRKILISALSLLHFMDRSKTDLENANIVCNDASQIANLKCSWRPILSIIENYLDLELIYLLVTPEVNKQLEFIDKKINGNPFEIYLKEQNRNIAFRRIDLLDINDFDEIVHKIDKKILKDDILLEREYEDENLIFNITSSTSAIAAALSIKGINGKRGVVIIPQGKNGEPEELKIDAWSMKDLLEELLEKF